MMLNFTLPRFDLHICCITKWALFKKVELLCDNSLNNGTIKEKQSAVSGTVLGWQFSSLLQ